MRYAAYLLIVATLGYLLTGVTQVRPGERAVVRRFGKIVDKPGPGLWVGLPYPFDRVDRVPIDLVRRVRIGYRPDADETEETTPPGQILTGDQNLVNAQVLLDYAVRDEAIEDYVVNADRVEGMIARAGEAVLAQWVAGHTVDEVLLRGKVELPAYLTQHAQAYLEPHHLGVVIQGASVAHLLPPTEVKREFDAVTSAQTQIRTLENVARQDAATRLRQADAERYQLERQTAAYVHEQISQAKAEAETFTRRLKQYLHLRQTNPNFLATIWWEEMGKLFTQMKANGRIDLLDNHLGGDGLDITIAPALPKKK